MKHVYYFAMGVLAIIATPLLIVGMLLACLYIVGKELYAEFVPYRPKKT